MPPHPHTETVAGLIRKAEVDLARAYALRFIARTVARGTIDQQLRRQLLQACMRLQGEEARLRARATTRDRRLATAIEHDQDPDHRS